MAIRNLGYISWKDPWAWMEPMKGKRWHHLLRQEQSHYHQLLRQSAVVDLAPNMRQELLAAQRQLNITGFTILPHIDLRLSSSSQVEWKWSDQHTYHKAYDLDIDVTPPQPIIAYVTDQDKQHPYQQQLLVERRDGHRLWTRSNVSTDIAIQGGHCYYIQMNDLRAVSLHVCDLLTGKQDHLLYEEKDEECSIFLVRVAGTLYLQSEAPHHESLYRIQHHTIYPVYSDTTFQLPAGFYEGQDAVLTRQTPTEPWTTHGILTSWKLPPPTEEIKWINLITGHVITIHEGGETVWKCSSGKEPRALIRLKIGSFTVHAWESWMSQSTQHLIAYTPYQPPFLLRLDGAKVTSLPSPSRSSLPPSHLEVHKGHTFSLDGTRVPYVWLHERHKKPKAVLVYVYGAYGSSSVIEWPHPHWYPLLHRGWAIAYALVRGGGDDTAAWAEAARRDHRHRSIDDFEAVIRAVQQKLHLGPKQTAIYGRSAGGIPVGAIVARWPSGSLVGAAFTEAPYVDVLRTTTNPSLPLTVGEYEEFGNPIKHISHFRELLFSSPVNSLPADGAPGVFVLSRVGLLDRQVYPYESFKWIQRLRGHVTPEEATQEAKGKYVTFENEDHVYRQETFPTFRARDLAILEAWVSGLLRF